MPNLTFDIKGMSCAACVNHIEQRVSHIHAIKTVQVQLLTNSMRLEVDEGQNQADVTKTVMDAVKKAGYEAIPKGASGFSGNEDTNQASTYTTLRSANTNTMISLAEEAASDLWHRFLYSLVGWLPLMVLNMGPMIGLHLPWVPDATSNPMTVGLLNALLTLPPVWVNRHYFAAGFRALRQGSPTMDSLVAVGSSAAIAYGLYVLFKLATLLETNQASMAGHWVHQLFFESAATILTLVTLGKYLEANSKHKTTAAITGLMNLSPKTATIQQNGNEVEIPVEAVKKGDIVVFKAGQTAPVDGMVLEGQAYVDESALTGESIPVLKNTGDTIRSGTVCKDGYLVFEATHVGEEATLNQIIRLMEATVASKAPVSKLVDRISRWFVPTVLVLAIVTMAGWLLAGHPFEFALTTSIAVLVIACPCALGLATPVAIMVGTGRGAAKGLLFKSAEALELAHQVDTLFLDKTGTLTTGHPTVKGLYPVEGQSATTLLKVAASLEKLSTHPLGKAVIDKAQAENVPLLETTSFKVDIGAGLSGNIQGDAAIIGHQAYLEAGGIAVEESWMTLGAKEAGLGHTVLFVAHKGSLLGLISVADSLKPGAKEAIAQLQRQNRHIVLLTGDRLETANAIATEAGINRVEAGLTPQEKQALVEAEQAKGHKVAMVGDGINDAPALAAATVGIAMGRGTDIALESADVVLMRDDLNSLLVLFTLSRNVMRTIKENLFWAFFYNVIGIPLAAGLFYLSTGWLLSPMVAAAAMSLSSVTVVLNALRLRGIKLDTSNKHFQKNSPMKTILHIEGMSCHHCTSTVEKALTAINGVQATVSLSSGTATVEHENSITVADLIKAVEAAGYSVKN